MLKSNAFVSVTHTHTQRATSPYYVDPLPQVSLSVSQLNAELRVHDLNIAFIQTLRTATEAQSVFCPACQSLYVEHQCRFDSPRQDWRYLAECTSLFGQKTSWLEMPRINRKMVYTGSNRMLSLFVEM